MLSSKLLSSLILVCYLVCPARSGDWQQFKEEHGKSYAAPIENSMREEIFKRNKRLVEEFNSENKDHGYNLKVNHMSDWTDQEYKQLLGDSPVEAEVYAEDNDGALDEILNEPAPVPDSVDWTLVDGRVSEVKNQGSCGSCWAFATTGLLEGQVGPKLNRSLVSLSEQSLVDCSTSNHGCKGGTAKDALEDVANIMGGIQNAGSYEYQARQGSCELEKRSLIFAAGTVPVKGGILLPEGDEDKLKEVVGKFGPVAVSIDASSFRFHHYNAGIYYNVNCHKKREQLDHAVLVVGYSSDPVYGDYWIVKNSWSEGWGEKGFIRMARNRGNHCGIATAAVIPKF